MLKVGPEEGGGGKKLATSRVAHGGAKDGSEKTLILWVKKKAV